MHLRRGRGYGGEIRAEGDHLVLRCLIGDCDWTDSEGPKDLPAERVLYDRWTEHRQMAHRHGGEGDNAD